MSVEENKALVRRFVEEFWSAGNLAAADELIAEDARLRSQEPGRWIMRP